VILQIAGKRWRLRFVKGLGTDVGQCDSPSTPQKEIRILASLSGIEKLDTIIHEFFHAANWHVDEEFTDAFATDLARTLWRLGYREVPEESDG
jgi:hypothetical protein